MRAPDAVQGLRLQLSRQIGHWLTAAAELGELTRIAPAPAWAALESYLGTELQRGILDAVDRLRRQGEALQAALRAADTWNEHQRLQKDIISYRDRYLRVETLVDFYADALAARSNPAVTPYLRACDILAARALSMLLVPLGRRPPPVLSYLDSGRGARILKAGLRLWDGYSESRVASIKISLSFRLFPTALLHEAGHQAAHQLGWNEDVAATLRRGLPGTSNLNGIWASWASELTADAFAFAHTGYAAVAALHDVVNDRPAAVMHVRAGDPHPASYLRVLLGCHLCRRFYGAGPWDALATAWRDSFSLDDARGAPRDFFEASVEALPRIVELLLEPCGALGGRSLASWVDPGRVAPAALDALERSAGQALYVSSHWVNEECLRLLALSGLRAATRPDRARELITQQEAWMRRLGQTGATESARHQTFSAFMGGLSA
jgi:hypothetical protein